MFYRQMFEGPHRLLAEISNKVRLGTTNEDGFDIIMACAAEKADFSPVRPDMGHTPHPGGLCPMNSLHRY